MFGQAARSKKSLKIKKQGDVVLYCLSRASKFLYEKESQDCSENIRTSTTDSIKLTSLLAWIKKRINLQTFRLKQALWLDKEFQSH